MQPKRLPWSIDSASSTLCHWGPVVGEVYVVVGERVYVVVMVMVVVVGERVYGGGWVGVM